MLTRKSARQAARECGGQIEKTGKGFIVKIKCLVKLEDGKPIIFTDCEARSGLVECFTFSDGHNEATREYMRACKKADPETTAAALARYRHWLGLLPTDATEIVPVARIRR